MADGSAGGEWCSFAEFSASEFNSFETNKFKLETGKVFFDGGDQQVEENDKWNVDFDNVFTVGSCANENIEDVSWTCANKEATASPAAPLNQHYLENDINLIADKCFDQDTALCLNVPSEEKECGLYELYIKSKLHGLFQSTGLDPVKSENTIFHKLKLNNIISQLRVTQVVENWMSTLNQVNTRSYEDDFDYHSNVDGERKMTPSKIVQNGVHIKETVLTDNSIFIDKKIESTLKKVNTHSKSVLPQLENDVKKSSEELEQKSLEEVKSIIYELQIQANIYSELLLNELDYRDKLKRDIEGQNNFISSYVAVERKINENQQNKKKKSRYGFFKQNEEEAKLPVSIPYIQRDGGPKPADLALMTEILKAVEREDQGVSKLISDYVINLGDQHNLQTVIKVRTRNGVTSLSAPEHKKKNLEDANNV